MCPCTSDKKRSRSGDGGARHVPDSRQGRQRDASFRSLWYEQDSLSAEESRCHSTIAMTPRETERKDTMTTMKQPRWHPISALPLVAQAIDGMLDAAEGQHPLVRQAQQRPHVLDDATVQRLIRVSTEQATYLDVYEEQLRRWRQTTLTESQRQDVERLTTQLARLRTVVHDILTMSDALPSQTIEQVLGKSDLDVAIEVLTGKLKF